MKEIAIYCGLAVFVVGLAGGGGDVASNRAVADEEAIHEIIVTISYDTLLSH